MCEKILRSDIAVNYNEFLGSGIYGLCHLTSDGKVFKMFNSSEPEYYVNHLSRIIGVKNDLYVMPEKIVCDNRGRAIGVLLPYINSLNLACKSIAFDELYSQIDNLYFHTDELSILGIMSFDIKKENILYTDSFKIIDTDMYHKENNPSFLMKNHIKDSNLKMINYGALDIIGLAGGCKTRDIYKIVNSNNELRELYQQLLESDDNRHLKEFLYLLKNKVSTYSNSLVDTKDYYKFKI